MNRRDWRGEMASHTMMRRIRLPGSSKHTHVSALENPIAFAIIIHLAQNLNSLVTRLQSSSYSPDSNIVVLLVFSQKHSVVPLRQIAKTSRVYHSPYNSRNPWQAGRPRRPSEIMRTSLVQRVSAWRTHASPRGHSCQ